MDTKTKRKFTGKLTNFISKEERNFCKKQLKAYLKGWEWFSYKQNEYKTPQIIEA